MTSQYDWVSPVTDRADGSARMTYIDMDRITQNLAYLYYRCQDIGVNPDGSAVSKTNWTQNDIITVDEWSDILECLDNVCDAIQYIPSETPNYIMIYTNVNNVEKIEQNCYDIINTYDRLPDMNHYIGDMTGATYRYSGDNMNSGGRYR